MNGNQKTFRQKGWGGVVRQELNPWLNMKLDSLMVNVYYSDHSASDFRKRDLS